VSHFATKNIQIKHTQRNEDEFRIFVKKMIELVPNVDFLDTVLQFRNIISHNFKDIHLETYIETIFQCEESIWRGLSLFGKHYDAETVFNMAAKENSIFKGPLTFENLVKAIPKLH
jgi:hypothetical protein